MFSQRTLSQLLVPLFSLTILALLAPAWSDGPPASSKDRARTITVAVETPDPVDPLPVQPGQVIDEASGQPTWIVMLNERPAGRNPAAAAIDRSIDAVLLDTGVDPLRASYRFRHAIVGFAAPLSPLEAGRLAVDPRVKAVDAAGESQFNRVTGNRVGEVEASWEHRRISNPEGNATSLDRCGATGAGVTVVVIDSGINAAHAEVAGRVDWSLNFYPDDATDGSDVNGHGTAVASIAAGSTIGVAPDARIASLRVGNPQGRINVAATIAALDWTVAHADEIFPAVVNMSLGGLTAGTISASYEASLASLHYEGIPIFVAAGNSSLPASWVSPATSVFASTIGATDGADHPSPFTNWGPFVDLWAPGSSILCADWLRPDGGLKLDDGTSEATPMAAGVAALHLERNPPTTEELESPDRRRIAERTRLAMIASAAEGRLSDRVDPIWTSPGGNAVLAGGANRLLQSCDRVDGLEPAPIQWKDGVASIRLGDGITPIPTDYDRSHLVSHPDGPVEVVINLLALAGAVVSMGPDDSEFFVDSRVRIFDAADDRVLFDSDIWIQVEPILQTVQRVVRSSGTAGVRIEWSPRGIPGESLPGLGYAMTALVVDPCVGDLDGDGIVNGLDLQRVLAQWGPCPIDASCTGDLTGDGIVGGADFSLLLANWGECPDLPTRGFVFDCNGNEVPRSILGDAWPDQPGTESRLVLVGRHGAITTTPVDLVCPELTWDTNDGTFVVSELDPREGACFENDGCGLAPLAACLGAFAGAGTECSPLLQAWNAVPLISDRDGVVIGYPWNVLNDMRIRDIRLRQPVPSGVRSISGAFMVLQTVVSASGTLPALNLETGELNLDFQWSYGTIIPHTPFEITIEFTDGGPSEVFRSVPVTNPVYGFPSLTVYRFGTLLADGSREVRSIEFSPDPTGIAPVSSTLDMRVLGAPVNPDGDTAGSLEISSDGGRSWEIYRDSNGQNYEWGMLLIP